MSDDVKIIVNGAAFARAVLAVEKSAVKDDSRPVLAGIRLETDPNALTLVAADGYRLSYATLDCACDAQEPLALCDVAIILPVKPLVAFARKAKASPTVTISPAPGGMWALCNDKSHESVIIPVIDGEYPDWRKIAGDVAGGELQALATYNARYLAEAAATAPPDTMLTIRRKDDKTKNPGVLAVREVDGTEIVTHIIMPMLTGVDMDAAS